MTKGKQRRAALLLGAVTLLLAAAAGRLLLTPDPPETPIPLPMAERSAGEDAFRLDLNDAAAEELECLPGIGPVLAESILTRRQELGSFRTREDILSVPGIGEAVYEKIEPFITY